MTRLQDARFDTRDRRKGWLWLLSLLLVGVGARLWLIQDFGTPLPFWDQWDETRVVFIPFFQGKLSLAALLSPHNEHRIFFTRVYDLSLLLLDGQWDNQLQMVGNVFIYSATITGFGWLLGRLLGRNFWLLITLPLMLILALPFAWENTLSGFQSQVYFMTFFSLLTLWLLGFFRPGSLPWSCGVLTAFCSLFTMGAGFLAPAAACALVTLRILTGPAAWKQGWPTLAASLVLVGLGLALKVDVPYHRTLQAHSITDFLLYLSRYLAWPWIVLPPFALFSLLPLLLLAWLWLRHPQVRMPAEEIVLVVGLWAILQAVASAYARGGQTYPQWRYMDSAAFLMISNVLSLALLGSRHRQRLPFPSCFRAGASLWALACASGLVLLCWRAWTVDIPLRQMQHWLQLLTARAYLATGDASYLEVRRPEFLARYALGADPRTRARALVEMLQAPYVRSLLPACARDPLILLPESALGFVTNGAALAKPDGLWDLSWGSYTTAGAAAKGRFESLPVPASKLPFLEFSVAGDLSQPGLALSLVDLNSGKITPVEPCPPPGAQWQSCRVKAPRGPFKIVAQDNSATGWFAFKAPRELGRLSFWAIQLLRSRKILAVRGAGLAPLQPRNAVRPQLAPRSSSDPRHPG